MQWAYESKKLDCTVKHLSWVPPWVDQGDVGEVCVGRRFLGDDSILVPDTVGLGRHPSFWWTMNCKYNAAYDVQRLNVKSASGAGILDDQAGGDQHERFVFLMITQSSPYRTLFGNPIPLSSPTLHQP